MNYIIVGLGNPGEKYLDTRHNVGRMVLNSFCGENNFGEWEERGEIKALKTDGVFEESLITLLQPNNYMNNSGVSVSKYIKNLSEDERGETKLVVVHDDIDLPIGIFRISSNRGSGGHKGVDSISTELKTKDFIRVRVGIAPITFFGKMRKPKGAQAVEKHVLKKFTKSEFHKLEDVFKNCNSALTEIIKGDVDVAMNNWNGK